MYEILRQHADGSVTVRKPSAVGYTTGFLLPDAVKFACQRFPDGTVLDANVLLGSPGKIDAVRVTHPPLVSQRHGPPLWPFRFRF